MSGTAGGSIAPGVDPGAGPGVPTRPSPVFWRFWEFGDSCSVPSRSRLTPMLEEDGGADTDETEGARDRGVEDVWG